MVARRPLRRRMNRQSTAEELAEMTARAERPSRGGGRPTKYRPDYARIAEQLCKLGATDHDLARAFGVTTVTIWNWRCSYPEFFNALTKFKDVFDELVERSLAQRALGYTIDEEIVKITNEGDVFREQTIKHMPPDTTACLAWLNNRQPERWRSKQQVEMTGANGGPIETNVVDARRVLEQQLTAIGQRLAQESQERDRSRMN